MTSCMFPDNIKVIDVSNMATYGWILKGWVVIYFQITSCMFPDISKVIHISIMATNGCLVKTGLVIDFSNDILHVSLYQ